MKFKGVVTGATKTRAAQNGLKGALEVECAFEDLFEGYTSCVEVPLAHADEYPVGREVVLTLAPARKVAVRKPRRGKRAKRAAKKGARVAKKSAKK